ncbi:MAG TPA: trypsin-like serine protease [Kofleriaceae bacterium]|jgi:secreted trypsin-like serine protease|nr:trypsin-like serine protease [Kofleriaceae bacterium]
MRRLQLSQILFGLSLSVVSLGAACVTDGAVDDETVGASVDEIVGGTATTIDKVPWQVALTTNSGFQFCGGSILSANWVLTAQHCVADGSSDMRVVAATTRMSQQSAGQIRAINAVARFPGFTDPTVGKDISLVHLATPLDLSGVNAKAIARVTAADAAAGATNPGVVATVTGWGTTSEGASTTSDVLMTVDVPVVSNATASTEYGMTISADQLPAGLVAGGKDSCQGDSGGPITVSVGGVRKLAGAVSWGNGCARPNFVGLYARVSSFETYIAQRVSGTFSILSSLTGLSGASGSFTHRSVTVPSGARFLSVVVTGGTGDADLYVRQGSQPTTSTFNCRPFLNGNNEFCTIDSPAAGTWFFSLRGFTAYSGASVTVTVGTP